jgi:peroxiredoxin
MSKILSKRTLLIGGVGAAVIGAGAGLLVTNKAQAAVDTGARAPNFSVRDASGATRTLAEFAGRTVILEWTNRGCPYVQKHYNSQNMQDLQGETTDDGIVWLSVISSAPGEQGYVDGPQALVHAREVSAQPSAILLDPTGVMGRAYGARTTPHMYIINPEGVLVYQGAIDDRPSARPETLQGATNYVRAALADLAAGRAVATAQTTPYGCSVKYAA